MPPIENLIAFSIATILLAVSPGPDMLYVMFESIQNSFKHAISVATGLDTGVFVHTTLVALGVAVLIKQSDLAMWSLKIFGAIYLLYLAHQSWQTASPLLARGDAPAAESLFKLYRRGILMNLLNPKVSLFFIAFLPQFIDQSTASFLQITVLGLLFIALSWMVFAVVALMARQLSGFLQEPKTALWVAKGKAVFFVLLALSVFFL